MADTMHSTKLDYSIVIPVYFNEGCLAPIMTSLITEVIEQNPQYSCEVIFVDDGSGDGSLEELLRIRQKNPKIVKVIKLTRNFGQINALLAGFSHAKGKCVIAMSADGQDPPSLINDMLKAYFQEGFEVAVCIRKERDEPFLRIITSRIFYALIKRLSFPYMPEGGFDLVLLGERALDVLLRTREATPFFQGQILWMGYKIKFLEYRRRKRIAGKSRWSFSKKLTYLIDGVLAYSYSPIRLMSLAGSLLALLGLLYALIVFLSKLLFDNLIYGWAPLMIVILTVGGFQMLMMGIIGEYLWRTLSQVRQRDLYIIDSIYDDEEGSDSDA